MKMMKSLFLFLLLQLLVIDADCRDRGVVVIAANHVRRQAKQWSSSSSSQRLAFCDHSTLVVRRHRSSGLVVQHMFQPNGGGWTRQPMRRNDLQGPITLSVGSTSTRSSSKLDTPPTEAQTGNTANNVDDKQQLKLFNSLTRQKDPFHTIVPNCVSMYTCGPTVYDYAHVGNFRAFLTYDLIKRVLMYLGYKVDHICNLTDVDDKIIKRCNEQGISLLELTQKYEEYFMNDLRALNIIEARAYPRATDHIPEMVELIQDLHKNGLAYQSEEGSWYFNVAKKEGYGQQLVSLDVDNMKENASGIAGQQRTGAGSTTDGSTTTSTDADEYDADKIGVRDFALWKAFKPDFDRDDAVWDTPIGRGRPGWHLECSAMARKFLGDSIDLHCGGLDLKFPHHENEIAQSEGTFATNNDNDEQKRFCNCWLHSGFVNINDEKMSKSKGNFLALRQACPTNDDVRAYRYLVVTSQYRQALSFTKEATTASKRALKRIDRLMEQLNHYLKDTSTTSAPPNDEERSSELENVVQSHVQNFELAILDDINTPRAAAAMFGVVKAGENEIKRFKKEVGDGDETTSAAMLDRVGLQKVQDALLKMDQIFGIFYTVPSDNTSTVASGQEESSNNVDDDNVMKEITQLLAERTEAKKAKNFELADSIRNRISELGFSVKDVKGGESTVVRN